MIDNEKNPLLVIGIKGEQYVYKTDYVLDYSTYCEIKKIAENKTLYDGNARCVNPDVLAHQFTEKVRALLKINLVKIETWPQMVMKLKNK